MVSCPACECVAELEEFVGLVGINHEAMLLAMRCHCDYSYVTLQRRDEGLDIVVQDVMGEWFLEEMGIIDTIEKMQAVWLRQESRAPGSVVREPAL